MDVQHMPLQLARKVESFTAYLACVWVDASVRRHMYLQSTGVGEAFPTSFTIVGVDIRVLVLVPLQIA